MAVKKGLTKEQVSEAILATNGLLTEASDLLGVKPPALQYWIKNHPECAEARDEALERRKDIAERQLQKLIEGRETKAHLGAICFFLKCRAKDRGYIERVEDSGRVPDASKKDGFEKALEEVSTDKQVTYRRFLSELVERGEREAHKN